jgi:hypothetical protein
MSDLRIWDNLMRRLSRAGDAVVEVGVFSDASAYPDGTPAAVVAMVHEYGSRDAGVPERSFVRSTVVSSQNQLSSLLGKAGRRLIHGVEVASWVSGSSDSDHLAGVGQWLVEQIRGTLSRGVPPPLEPETSARKGSTSTLVDTGHLRDSVSMRVRPRR